MRGSQQLPIVFDLIYTVFWENYMVIWRKENVSWQKDKVNAISFNKDLYQVVTCVFFTVLQASEVFNFPDLQIVLFVESISL